MLNRTSRAFQVAVFVAVVIPLLACGEEKLSDTRVRIIRQSPFLFVPPSATQLASIDINRLRQLSIYKDLKEVFLRDEGRLDVWNELSRRQGGDDPLTQIDQVIFAGYAPKFSRPMKEVVLIITGNWKEEEKFLEAIQLLAGQGFLDNPPAFQPLPNITNGYSMTATSTLHPGESTTLYVAFPGPGICVFSLSKSRFEKCHGAIFEKLPAITDDGGWNQHFSRIRLDQPIWAAGWTPIAEWRDFMQEKVETLPELKDLWNLVHNHPVNFYAYLGTQDRYLLDVEMICETSEAAGLFEYDLNKARRVIPRMLNSWFNGDIRKIDEWRIIFDEIEVRQEEASLFFELEMTEEEATRLIQTTALQAEATPTPEAVPDPFRRRD